MVDRHASLQEDSLASEAEETRRLLADPSCPVKKQAEITGQKGLAWLQAASRPRTSLHHNKWPANDCRDTCLTGSVVKDLSEMPGPRRPARCIAPRFLFSVPA